MKPTESLSRLIDTLKFNEEINFRGGIAKIIRGPLFPSIVMLLFIYATAIIIKRYLDLEVWRHDSFEYTPDSRYYEGNLKETGRWIIYYLFDFAKWIPTHIAAIANLIFSFLFGYLVTKSLVRDKYLQVLFGLSILLIPVLHAQNLWPNTTFLAFAFLPLCFYLSKKLHPILFFLVSGILFFGTISHFYFLMPLVYLGKLKDTLSGNFKKDAFFTLGNILIPYAVCFILGYLVANLMVYLKTGGPVIVGEWRSPSPAHDMAQLLDNLSAIHTRMTVFGSKILTDVNLVPIVAMGLLTLISLNKKSAWIFLVLLVMALSVFYTTAYHGIHISTRTLFASFVPLLAIFILLPALRFEYNVLHYGLCLLLMFPLFRSSSNHLLLFGKISNYHKTQIAQSLQTVNMDAYNEALILAKKSDHLAINKQIKEYYDLEFIWCEHLRNVDRTMVTGLKSLGFTAPIFLPEESVVDNVKDLFKNQVSPQSVVTIQVSGRPNTLGILLRDTKLDTILLESL